MHAPDLFRDNILVLAEIAFQKRGADVVEIDQILDIAHQKQLRLPVVEADAETVERQNAADRGRAAYQPVENVQLQRLIFQIPRARESA